MSEFPPIGTGRDSKFQALPLFASSRKKTSRGGTGHQAESVTTAHLASSLQACRPSTSSFSLRVDNQHSQSSGGHHASPRSTWTNLPANPGSNFAHTVDSIEANPMGTTLSEGGMPLSVSQNLANPRSPRGGVPAATSPSFSPLGATERMSRHVKSPLTDANGSIFKDLRAATNKSLAASKGEWDLQALDWGHQEFRERLLQGPLGPEALKTQYGMNENSIVRLYQVLYAYSTGFYGAVLEPTQHAKHKDRLMDVIIQTYAQLFDEALGLSLQSEIVETLHHISGASAVFRDMSMELGQTKSESLELKSRLNDFVKGNVESMLAQRQLTEKAAGAQAEAMTLSRTNEELSIRLSGSEIKVQALTSQLEVSEKMVLELQARTTEKDTASLRLKAALKEIESTASRQFFQIVELEAALARANQDKAIETETRRELERLNHISREGEATWEKRLADKALAYNLIHSDYLVKMHDLDELRGVNQKQKECISNMESTYLTAKRQIAEAEALAEKHRAECASMKAYMTQLEIENKRQNIRIQDLVKSYWPLVSRVKEAEAGAVRMKDEVAEAEARVKEMQRQMDEIRVELSGHEALKQELKTLREETSIGDIELSEACLTSLHPDAISARAYVRAGQRRIRDLTQHVVRLVDVNAGHEARMKDMEDKEIQLRTSINQLKAQLKTAGGLTAEERLAAVPNVSSVNLDLQAQVDRAVAAMRQEEASKLALEQELQGVRNEASRANARLESWLASVADQASSLLLSCEEVMRRDPEAPISHTQLKLLGIENQEVVKIKAGTEDGSEEVTAKGNLADGIEDSMTSSKETPSGDSDLSLIAIGRLAQGANALSEGMPTLVRADWRWEQLCDCLERMRDWGGCLLDKKMQVQGLVDMKTQIKTLSDALEASKKQLEDAKARADKAEALLAADAEAVRKTLTNAAKLEAGHAEATSGLLVANGEVAALTGRLTLLEEEYWTIKAKLLEAEMTQADIVASRDQAILQAQHAKEAMKILQSEAEHNKVMRETLELDLIGCKAWIRGMEDMERHYQAMVLDLGIAQEKASSNAALVVELRSKVQMLESQLEVSEIHTRSSQEQVNALLRDLQAAEVAAVAREATGSGSNAVLQRSSAASEASKLKQETTTWASKLKVVEVVAETAKAAAREATEETSRVRVELSEALSKSRAAEQLSMELRSVAASAKIQAERLEERLRHSQSEKEILELMATELRSDLGEALARGEALQGQVWDLNMAVQKAEAERKAVLERAVDTRFDHINKDEGQVITTNLSN